MEISRDYLCVYCLKNGESGKKLTIVLSDAGDNFVSICLEHLKVAVEVLEKYKDIRYVEVEVDGRKELRELEEYESQHDELFGGVIQPGPLVPKPKLNDGETLYREVGGGIIIVKTGKL